MKAVFKRQNKKHNATTYIFQEPSKAAFKRTTSNGQKLLTYQLNVLHSTLSPKENTLSRIRKVAEVRKAEILDRVYDKVSL